jgi:hypothetical protein
MLVNPASDGTSRTKVYVPSRYSSIPLNTSSSHDAYTAISGTGNTLTAGFGWGVKVFIPLDHLSWRTTRAGLVVSRPYPRSAIDPPPTTVVFPMRPKT